MPPEKVIEELENEIHLVEYVDGLYAENISLELLKSVRDLINRQQTDNKRLKIENQSLRAAANSYKIHYDKARTEAVKEFAESLCKDRVSNDPVVITVQIELKEWLGDKE